MNKIFFWIGCLLARIYFLFKTPPKYEPWKPPVRKSYSLTGAVDIHFGPEDEEGDSDVYPKHYKCEITAGEHLKGFSQ